MPRVIVHGAGGNTRTLVDILLQTYKSTDIICIDNLLRPNESIQGVPVCEEYTEGSDDIHFISIGDNSQRYKAFIELKEKHKKMGFCVSMDAYISKSSVIVNENNQIYHQAYLGPEVIMEYNNIINTGAIIEHEVKIGRNTHIAPRACICGRVVIGSNVFIGANATIKEKVSICDHAVIGAGAVVVKDIVESGVYVGIPVRRIR